MRASRPMTLPPLLPQLHPLNEILFMSTQFAVRKGEVRLKNMQLSNATDRFYLSTDATLSLPQGKFSAISAQLQKLSLQQHFVRSAMNALHLKELPEWLRPLETIELKGKLRYATTHSSYFDGQIISPIGKIELNANYWKGNLTGQLSSRNLRPALLKQIPNLPTMISLEAKGHLQLNGTTQPNGRIELKIPEVEWRQHHYKNLATTASLFNGKADVILTSQ